MCPARQFVSFNVKLRFEGQFVEGHVVVLVPFDVLKGDLPLLRDGMNSLEKVKVSSQRC
jgi:hypothetical protein